MNEIISRKNYLTSVIRKPVAYLDDLIQSAYALEFVPLPLVKDEDVPIDGIYREEKWTSGLTFFGAATDSLGKERCGSSTLQSSIKFTYLCFRDYSTQSLDDLENMPYLFNFCIKRKDVESPELNSDDLFVCLRINEDKSQLSALKYGDGHKWVWWKEVDVKWKYGIAEDVHNSPFLFAEAMLPNSDEVSYDKDIPGLILNNNRNVLVQFEEGRLEGVKYAIRMPENSDQHYPQDMHPKAKVSWPAIEYDETVIPSLPDPGLALAAGLILLFGSLELLRRRKNKFITRRIR